MQKILIINTAFAAEVILATPIIEKLHQHFPEAQIDFVVRKGNGALLKGHPYLNKVFAWKKYQGKYSNLFKIIRIIRRNRYDLVVNAERFFLSGWMAAFSKGKHIIGFRKNPMSFLFDEKIGKRLQGVHETSRNLTLIKNITDEKWIRPKLYPRKQDYVTVAKYQGLPYLVIAPSTFWNTKEYPPEKWAELILSLDDRWIIYLVGAQEERADCEEIIQICERRNVTNLAGSLNFLEVAALIDKAELTYSNDSAPMHIASAMDAPTNAIFCSTLPAFGFGPLGKGSKVVQTQEQLSCRPCGLHGKKRCPLSHFKCAFSIQKTDFNPPIYRDYNPLKEK